MTWCLPQSGPAMRNIGVHFKMGRRETPAIWTLFATWLAMRAPAMPNRWQCGGEAMRATKAGGQPSEFFENNLTSESFSFS